MAEINRREFLRRSMILGAGITLASCENPFTGPLNVSPGALLGYQSPKRVIIVGAGISGLVAGYELSRVGHHVTILEARPRLGGRVLTLRAPFSDGHFAEAGAARIPSNHNLTLGYADHFGLRLDPFYAGSGSYLNVSGGIRSMITAADYLDAPPWPGSVIRGEYEKIRGGTDRLPMAFAGSLTNQIHLSKPVESIRQTPDGVVVRVAGGGEYAEDRALCTVPLPVLNKIQFTPPLSPEKAGAAGGGYNYAPSSRMFIQFTNRFWEGENLNGWGNTDWPEEIWHPSWDRGGPRGVLLSYLRNNRALELDQLGEADRLEHVLWRWSNVFPGLRDHAEQGVSHSWSLDEWSGGGWAAPTAAQQTALDSHIGRAEGRIHFAGEHASGYHGWIQGALVSGLRAAGEIHAGD